jgi:hypothetical protein
VIINSNQLHGARVPSAHLGQVKLLLNAISELLARGEKPDHVAIDDVLG